MTRPISKCEYECLVYLRNNIPDDPLLQLTLEEITVIRVEGGSFHLPITTWTENEMKNFRRMASERINS